MMDARTCDHAGRPSRPDIASAVHEAAGELASQIPLGHLCLIYSVAGAMVATQALGGRFVLQVGGYLIMDTPGRPVVLGPARPGHVLRSELDLHCWFTELPPGADPEDTWECPPWLKVADLWLRNAGPAAGRLGFPLPRRLPDFVWGPLGRVGDSTGIWFRPDRDAAHGFLKQLRQGPRSDYWSSHLTIAEQVARSAARKLGLPMGATRAR